MKPFTNKHSHEAIERAAADLNDMPIINKSVAKMNANEGSAILNAGHGGKGHPHPKQKDVNKPIVNIKASDSLGNMYGIDVRSGSAYEKMYKDLGAVPSAFRPGQGFTEGTDPRTSGLSKEEKAKRLKDAQTRPGGF